jgi:hypothetical protein
MLCIHFHALISPTLPYDSIYIFLALLLIKIAFSYLLYLHFSRGCAIIVVEEELLSEPNIVFLQAPSVS